MLIISLWNKTIAYCFKVCCKEQKDQDDGRPSIEVPADAEQGPLETDSVLMEELPQEGMQGCWKTEAFFVFPDKSSLWAGLSKLGASVQHGFCSNMKQECRINIIKWRDYLCHWVGLSVTPRYSREQKIQIKHLHVCVRSREIWKLW